MGRPRKIQTPGVTAPTEQQEVIEQAAQAVEQAPAEQVAAQSQEPADPNRPKRWVLQADGWHYE